MLVQNWIDMKWNTANKKKYMELGYKFTKMGDEFKVHIIDVSKGSNFYVNVECDYCGNITKKQIYHYFKEQEKIVKKDACGKCCNIKNKELNIAKYSVSSTQQLEHVKEKTKKTMLERYGYENAMKNDLIKDKLKTSIKEKYGVNHIFELEEFKNKAKQTMLNKYGVEWYTQTEEYKYKCKETCMSKYGVEYFFQSDEIQKMRIGENNPNWKGGFDYHNDKRNTPEYRLWRSSVFTRDDYTCSKCGIKGGRLNAHHIHNYATNEDLRFDIDNGITLCEKCHKEFHHINGYLNTNEEQLNNFIQEEVVDYDH